MTMVPDAVSDESVEVDWGGQLVLGVKHAS